VIKLKCHKCSHQWEDSPEPGQAAVMCPDCFALVPMHLAAPGAAAAGGATDVTAPLGKVSEMKAASADPDDKTVVPARPRTGDYIAEVQTVIQRTPDSPPPSAPQGRAPMVAPLPPIKPAGAQPRVLDEFQQTLMELEKTAPSAPPKGHVSAPSSPMTAPQMNTPSPASLHSAVEDPSEAGTMPSARPAHLADSSAPTRPSSDGVPSSIPSGQSGEKPRSVSQSASSSPGKMDLTGQMLGGYKITKKIGAGGMGAVFLARQVSLDRDVALKVLPAQLANNPELMMRFTREALSAAQLTHHNIIQVFDVGSEDAVHFIAMEFVKGKSLRELIKADGKLSMDDAAAYVLQAARGLKYAHERGIIHRDIKPDNLMLNEHGIIKIADMGLAKMVGKKEAGGGVDMEDERLIHATGDLTMAEVAMGTPAYMPPEQARDASTVDHRADQYSLGCTLYYLCAGKTPYEGKTAFDLITKHLNEPLIPLDVVVKNVPPALNEVIKRMLEKEPDKRYADMEAVIRDLEGYLGVASGQGEYKPREEHLGQLEQFQLDYYRAPALKLRKMVVPGFFLATLIGVIGAAASGSFAVTGGFIGLALLTPIMNFVIEGLSQKTFLFRRTKNVFFGMTMKGWAATIGMSVLALLILYFMQWLVSWILFAVLAGGLAFAYQRLVQAPLRAQRKTPVDRTQEMFKGLRVRGVSEEAVQDFACRFGGDHWEEFFEEIFGYPAMSAMRAKWGAMESVKPRKKFAIWRDPIFRWLDDMEASRRAYRERLVLEKAEKTRLKAKGVSEKEAERQAEDMATQIIATELLPKVPLAGADGKLKAQAMTGPARTHNIHRFGISPSIAFRVFRAVLGLFIVFGYLSANKAQFGLNIPDFIVSLYTSFVFSLGFGSSMQAGGIGAALALSAFSKRTFLPSLIIIGAALVVVANPITGLLAGLPGAPAGLTSWVIWGGLILAGLAFAKMVLNAFTGNRF
jgi:membrane protein implicated in regulation of membrane protease activity